MRHGKIGRLVKIFFIWQRFALDEMLLSTPWLRSFRFALWFNPRYWFLSKKNDRALRLRLALEALGPIFVKFGQMLSTRPDLVPEDIAHELVKLQDQVKPFPGEQAEAIIVNSLGMPLDQAFAEFELTPLASASVAQVHAATLLSGEKVVVKVIRPDIEKVLRQDIALLYMLARVLERFAPETRRLKLQEVVAELERNVFDELDLMKEAASCSQLRRNFQDSNMLYVPEIYWDFCRRNVLVMERIKGVPVTNMRVLKAHNVDLKLLAERGVEIFYTQVFRDCFFHADMHPGNIFVSIENPADPKYIAIDFGIMGTLNKEDQHYLAANFLAFFKRDYRRVAELHVESGWVPKDTRVDVLESALRTVCEPIFEKPLKDISFGQTLLRLFQIARRFNMEVQPQLLLLQKTLLNIEGMGRELYPDLDLWATAKPFLENWMREQVGFKGFWRRFKTQLPLISERLPEVPDLIYKFLKNHHENHQQNSITMAKTPLYQPPKPKSRLRPWLMGLGAGFFCYAIFSTPLLNSSSFHDKILASVSLGLIVWAFFRK